MKNRTVLENKTTNELQVLAKKARIVGWHKMRKNELLEALEKVRLPKTFTTIARSTKAVSAPMNPVSPRPTAAKSVISSVKGKAVVGKKKLPAERAVPVENDISRGTKSVVKKDEREEPLPLLPAEGKVKRKKASVPLSRLVTQKEKQNVKIVREMTPPKKGVAPVESSSKREPIARQSKRTTENADKGETEPRSEKGRSSVPFGSLPVDRPCDNKEVKERVMDEVQQRILLLKEKLLLNKTLGSATGTASRASKDQLILMVRDPFWLHAYWEISSVLVERIRAAMGHLWHTADPILRLYKVHSDNVGAIRQEYRTDIQIHGGINNWYIDVDDPPSSFMVEIGYLARDGQFFSLLSSNIVETPQRYIHDSFGHPDVSWMGFPPYVSPSLVSDAVENESDRSRAKNTNGHELDDLLVPGSFTFQVDSEVVIRGKTDPDVQLSIKGESIRLKEDGSFSIRYHLPERRHVFPVMAIKPETQETQTIILAFERNTKVLDPVLENEESE